MTVSFTVFFPLPELRISSPERTYPGRVDVWRQKACYVLIFIKPEYRPDNMIPPSAFYRLLSDESRLNILLLLRASGELCVCHICASLDISQPAISRNLAMLKGAGVLTDRRHGKWVYYRLSESLPVWMHDILEITQRQNQHVSGQIRQALPVHSN